MKLRCQLKGIKCPRYKHHGVFQPDDETVKRLLPDLNWCANCMAYATPRCPDIRDDLLQIASIVLVEKGPLGSIRHIRVARVSVPSSAPQICGILKNAKEKELLHSRRELPHVDAGWNLHGDVDAEADQAVGWLHEVSDLNSEFEDELVQNISFQETLPELLQTLTAREREVFACLRENQQNHEIAEALKLSEARVSQLVKRVTLKLTQAGQRLGLSE